MGISNTEYRIFNDQVSGGSTSSSDCFFLDAGSVSGMTQEIAASLPLGRKVFAPRNDDIKGKSAFRQAQDEVDRYFL